MAEHQRQPRKLLFREPLRNALQPLTERVKRALYGTPNFTILAGDAGMELAQQVGEQLNKQVPPNPTAFANNELRVVVPKIVETRDVYIIQAMNTHPNRTLRQLKLLGIGAKGRDANRIYNMFTHLPYARQDRIDQPGAPRAAQQVVQEIFDATSHNPLKRRHESKLRAPGALLVVDVHSEGPLQEVTKNSRGRYKWANVDSAFVLAPRVQELIASHQLDPVVAFPDKGAAHRYHNYVELFGNGQEPAVIKKERPVDQNNVVTIADSQEDLSGKVSGKDVLMFDDMIDTGGSILQAARLLKEQGARSVRVIATHGIFSNDALTKMSDPTIDQVIVTNTIQPTQEVLQHPKIDVVSIAPLLAEVIKRIENKESIADLVKQMSPGFEKSYRRLSKVNTYRRQTQRQTG